MRNLFLQNPAMFLACLLVASGQENQRSPLEVISDTVCSSGNGSSTWASVTSKAPWSNRTGHGAISFQEKIWVIGGEGTRSAPSALGVLLEDVWASSDGVTWTSPPPHKKWSGRHRFGIVAFNNKMWLLGGIVAGANETRQVCNEVWSSGTDGTTWNQVRVNTPCSFGQTLCLPGNASNTTAPVWAQRHTPITLVLKGRMWIISGVRSTLEQTLAETSAFTHDIWSTIDGVTWMQEAANTPWKGRRTAVGVVYQLKMYVLAESSDFRYYYNVWGSSDGVQWAEPSRACTVSGQLLGAALAIESGIVVLGIAGAYEGGLGNTSLWYSKPDRDFDGLFDRSQTPLASGARAESSYISFQGKMWQIGGACGTCGPERSPQIFNDVQVGTPLAFQAPKSVFRSGSTWLIASWNVWGTIFCVSAVMFYSSCGIIAYS